VAGGGFCFCMENGRALTAGHQQREGGGGRKALWWQWNCSSGEGFPRATQHGKKKKKNKKKKNKTQTGGSVWGVWGSVPSLVKEQAVCPDQRHSRGGCGISDGGRGEKRSMSGSGGEGIGK